MRTLAFSILIAGALRAPALAGPVVYSVHPGVHERARARVAAGDPALAPALARLREEADAAQQSKPPSVMDKPLVAASGDRHDYLSLAPYWWPDPARPDGLPYVRRDGETNPQSRQGTDRAVSKPAGEAFETLAIAYFLTGHEPYAEHAVRLLRTWFLDPATRMNPHLRYAQAIPGITDGRGIGIIEGRYLLHFVDWLPLVFDSPAWTKHDERAFRLWVEAYHHWLTTSPNGLDEADEPNNHGTWYDLQVIQLAMFLGHEADARERLARALEHRIRTQIEPDGRQPHELARTRPVNYSILNLEGLVRLTVLGEHLGSDAWATRDGARLARALEYVAPYIDPGKKAPDISAVDRGRLFPLFVEAERHIDPDRYRRWREAHTTAEQAAARWQLFR